MDSRRERRAWAIIALATGVLFCLLALADLPGVIAARTGDGRPGVAIVESVRVGTKGAVSVRADVEVDGRTYDDVVVRGARDGSVQVGQHLDVLLVRHSLEPTVYLRGRPNYAGVVGGAVLGVVTAGYALLELRGTRSRHPQDGQMRATPEPAPGRHRREDPPRSATPVMHVLQRIRRSA